MNKRLIIAFICLVVIAIPIIVISAVFTVGSIDVIAIGDGFEYDEEAIIENTGIKLGSSIFTVSEKKAIDNVESKDPTIKVVNIERIFPNKVVLNIVKRIPIVAIKTKDAYALIDREMRVVEITDTLAGRDLVIYEGYTLDKEGLDLSGIIELPKSNLGVYILDGIVKGFVAKEYVNSRLPAIVRSVSVNYDLSIASVNIETGTSFEIFVNSNVSIKDQLVSVIGIYEKDREDESSRIKSGAYYFDTDNNAWNWRA